MTFSEALFTFIKTTMSDGFSSNGAANKGALSNTQVTAWFEDLDNTVVDGLQLLDDVADTLLDIATTGVALIEAYFTYQYNSVASMGILGIILGEAWVDLNSASTSSSPGRRLPRDAHREHPRLQHPLPVHRSPAAVAPGQPRARPREGSRRMAGGPGHVGAVTQGIWVFADLVGDLPAFYDSDTGKRGTPWVSSTTSTSCAPWSRRSRCGRANRSTTRRPTPSTAGSPPAPPTGCCCRSSSGRPSSHPSSEAVAKAGWTSDLSNSVFPAGSRH